MRARLTTAALVVAAGASASTAVGGEIECPPVRGARALLERAEVVLVGEIHGTAESPAFVAALTCQALRDGRQVTVGFELVGDEADRFAEYLGSDGGEAARATLLAGPPWQATGQAQYGVTSEATLALIEELRRLRHAGQTVEVALFNRTDVEGSRDRDRKMAETLGQLIERSETGLFVALTGNIHSRLARGTRWDPEYEPMGYLLRRASPELRIVSLDVAHAGGSAWVCTPEGCGEQRLGARGETAGERFTVTVEDAPGTDGHHGRYFVGEIHASPPAVTGADR